MFKVAWNYNGKKQKAKIKSPLGRYEYCQMLEKAGATDIKIKYYAPYGEIVDSY